MPRSDFTTTFAELNKCQPGFKQWHFEEGMCFCEQKKWWARNEQARVTVHEGVDFCCYTNQKGRKVWLDEEIKIPAMFDGYIAEMFNDFVGQSVLIRHKHGNNGRQFCSIYAHIVPERSLATGMRIKAGQLLGQCALGKRVPTHLHLSVTHLLSSEKAIDWPSLIKHHAEHFEDPLQYI